MSIVVINLSLINIPIINNNIIVVNRTFTNWSYESGNTFALKLFFSHADTLSSVHTGVLGTTRIIYYKPGKKSYTS